MRSGPMAVWVACLLALQACATADGGGSEGGAGDGSGGAGGGGAAGGAGGDGGQGGAPPGCVTDDECRNVQTCVEGTCRLICSAHDDCDSTGEPRAELCLPLEGGGRACLPNPPGCDDDIECGPCEVCVADTRECRTTCRAREYCDEGACRGECGHDCDSPGAVCVALDCAAACGVLIACRGGYASCLDDCAGPAMLTESVNYYFDCAARGVACDDLVACFRDECG